MSSVRKSVIIGLLLISGLFFLGGCGSSESNESPFNAEDQLHPAGWLPAGHMLSAQADITVCADCHGEDYSGGISHVSCSQCHLGGTSSVHPISWGTGSQIVPNHGAYVQTNGATSCANIVCHGSNFAGVTDSGPACATCHVNSFSLPGCTSCHSTPPTGTTAPNRRGAHALHTVLPQVVNVCNTCHNGGGTGTVNHGTGTAFVSFLNAYNAKSGAASYNNADGTCSNVSCHGGQTAPGWLSGSIIDVNTQCTSCHSYGTTQYNSFVSGQHDFHVNQRGYTCIRCHDTVKLAVNHFQHLDTTVMEGPASATILNNVNYNGSTCSPLCHDTRSWF